MLESFHLHQHHVSFPRWYLSLHKLLYIGVVLQTVEIKLDFKSQREPLKVHSFPYHSLYWKGHYYKLASEITIAWTHPVHLHVNQSYYLLYFFDLELKN